MELFLIYVALLFLPLIFRGIAQILQGFRHLAILRKLGDSVRDMALESIAEEVALARLRFDEMTQSEPRKHPVRPPERPEQASIEQYLRVIRTPSRRRSRKGWRRH